MSCSELHTGTLKKIDTGGIPLEEFIKSLNLEEKLFEYDDSEILSTKEYVILNNELYIRDDIKYKDSEDVLDIQDERNGTYFYTVRFYNGGTYLDEVLENGLKGLKNDNKN